MTDYEPISQKAKQYLGDKNASTKDDRLGELRTMRNLYLSELHMPKISREDFFVNTTDFYNMVTVASEPFLEDSTPLKSKTKNRSDLFGDDLTSYKNKEQDRASKVFKILVENFEYPVNKPVKKATRTVGKEKIEQFAFEFTYKNVPLAIVVQNHYGYAIYFTTSKVYEGITRKELVNSDGFTKRSYGRKDETMLSEDIGWLRSSMKKIIEELVRLEKEKKQ